MLTIELPFPPSMNTYWRHVGAKVLVSREGRVYRDLVSKLILLGPHWNQLPLVGRLAMHIVARAKDRRARDLDNLGKAILDSLQYAGVYPNDSHIDDLHFVRGDTDPTGSVTVTISIIQPEEGEGAPPPP